MSQCGHADHSHSAEELLASAEAACALKGLRWTPLRRQVFALVVRAGRPVKAYELLDQLKAQHAGAAPPTVYRALDFLMEHGLIHKLESIAAYVCCPHPGAAHATQFLICDACDRTIELQDELLTGRLNAAVAAQGFVPGSIVVEVHGRCAQCAVVA
ncbi:MAG: transcriptional repressor [Xanthomonadales bacterium]|jgi:Fur family zinc uptake transcriptional regulator|nr:transcriptional repressor [Xanthomonadales bacterium]